MVLKLTNNATSTLATAISASDTAISIQPGDAGKFPSLVVGEWFPLTVVDAAGNMEIMRVTARNGSVFTVLRAQEDTTAKAFSNGSRADLRLTVQAILNAQIQTDWNATEGVSSIKNRPDLSNYATKEQGEKADGAVRFNEDQSLDDNQKTQARKNISSLSTKTPKTDGSVTVEVENADIKQAMVIRRKDGSVEWVFDITSANSFMISHIAADGTVSNKLTIRKDAVGEILTNGLLEAEKGIRSPWVQITGAGQPANANDAATKAYVDKNASIGVGQWYQSPGRSTGTVYQNTTGRPIIVMMSGSYGTFQQHSGDGNWFEAGLLPNINAGAQFTCVVPPGNYYRLANATNRWMWQELRT